MNFQNVRLKKTETRVASADVAPLICNNSDDYARLMAETYLEVFLNQLGEQVTFSTFLIPCGVELCRALIGLHKHEPLDDRSRGLLDELRTAIDSGMRERGWPLCFVRLSSRSPKDAALTQPFFQGNLYLIVVVRCMC